MIRSYIPVLTIAGSDSSGGAGIQADIKTMSSLGCYGMSVITAITAQNTTGVSSIQGVNADVVSAQIDMVYNDITPLAVKTGMLFSSEIVIAVTDTLRRHRANNLVIDPVMVSTSGVNLISDDAIEKVVKLLFPISSIITPNRAEALTLTGTDDVTLQAQRLHQLGANAVLLKGGDYDNGDFKIDYLSLRDVVKPIIFKSKTVDTVNTHGTGCTLSSAIASYLAIGYDLVHSVRLAKKYITLALDAGKSNKIGNGHGPVNHFFNPNKLITKVYENNS